MRCSARRCCNLYAALGVSRQVSQQQLRESYLKLVKIHHPDRHLNAGSTQKVLEGEKFKTLQNAWEILSDPKKRAQYDQTLLQAGPAPFQPRPRGTSPVWAHSRAESKKDQHWEETIRAKTAQAAQRRAEEERRRREDWFRNYGSHTSYSAQHHQHATQNFKDAHRRQVDELLSEFKKDPNMRQFLQGGQVMKLMCQLGAVLGVMLTLTFHVWLKASNRKDPYGHSRPRTQGILSFLFV